MTNHLLVESAGTYPHPTIANPISLACPSSANTISAGRLRRQNRLHAAAPIVFRLEQDGNKTLSEKDLQDRRQPQLVACYG